MERLFAKSIDMLNIAKKPIKIGEGVSITVEGEKVLVKGPKGELQENVPNGIKVITEGDLIRVKTISESKDLGKLAGLARALIANMVEGVTQGFQKNLELTGVGYRANVSGQDLILNVGFAVPVKISPPQGVTVLVNENIITVAGLSKQRVGDIASDIRRVKPPDPYKGKGIKYVGEKLRKKAGKAAKAVGAVK